MSTQAMAVPEDSGAGVGGGGTRRPPSPGGSGRFFGWLRRLLLRLLSWRHCNVNGFVEHLAAENSAEAREHHLTSALDDVATREFLELPPGLLLERALAGEVRREEVAARQVALEWQLSSPRLMLLGRVCDTIDALTRQLEERGANADHNAVVALRPVPRLTKRLAPKAFPLRVVVETSRPAQLRARLSDYADWYGIGVHVKRGRAFSRLRGCTHPDGRDGTVGGVVNIYAETYGLTCGHVLSAQCPSTKLRLLPKPHDWSPDAALVRLNESCLPIPDYSNAMTATSFTEAIAPALEHAAVCLRMGGDRCRTGFLKGVTLYASDREGPLRFPSVFVGNAPPISGCRGRRSAARSANPATRAPGWHFERIPINGLRWWSAGTATAIPSDTWQVLFCGGCNWCPPRCRCPRPTPKSGSRARPSRAARSKREERRIMADPATTTNFLTAASIGTFAGATIAVWAVTNTLRRAFNIERAYIPLVVALLVSIGLAIQSGMYKSFLGILLTILNACLLFLSAAGMQQAGDIEFRGTEGASRQGKKRVGWFTPWFKSRRHTPAAVPEAAA